jgi:hypothetical protein
MESWEDIKRENAKKAAAAAAEAAAKAQRDAEWDAAAPEGAEPEKCAPAPPPNVAATPAPSTQIKGGSGRTASVGTRKVITALDLEKCWTKFRDLPEVLALFMELAEKRMAAGLVTAEEIGAIVEEKAAIR